MLGLASCGLASAFLPCGSHFPQSPLDLLELEAFHGLSLPQAKPQIAGKAGEVCQNHPWLPVGELRGGPRDGDLILEAFLESMQEDQEFSLTSRTLGPRLDQPASRTQAFFCSCWFPLQAGGRESLSQPVLFLGASILALSALEAVLAPGVSGGQALSPPRLRCCLQLDEKCPLLHHRVFGCQEGDFSFSNARIWLNLSPSHHEGEGAISACPSRERFRVQEAKGIASWFSPPLTAALLVPESPWVGIAAPQDIWLLLPT